MYGAVFAQKAAINVSPIISMITELAKEIDNPDQQREFKTHASAAVSGLAG